MPEKMTIEKAKDIVRRFGATKGYIDELNSVTDVFLKGKFYIEGYESRQEEIDELNKTIDELSLKLGVVPAENVLTYGEGMK